MHRLLILCRHPYHVHRDEAETWLRQELVSVLSREALDGARLTRLSNPSPQWVHSYDWLVELRLTDGVLTSAMARGGACAEFLDDLRSLGMEPTIAVAHDRDTVELELP